LVARPRNGRRHVEEVTGVDEFTAFPVGDPPARARTVAVLREIESAQTT
jgi:hypothetical protein